MTQRRMLWRITAATLTAATVALAPPAIAAGSATGPRDVVQSIIDAGLEILQRDGLSTRDRREELLDMVEQHFDFETLSKLVLARHWQQFSPEQRKEFVAVFRTHLALTYSKNLERYENETAVITGEQEEARGDWTVRTKVVRPGAEDVLVNYRLRQRGGAWRMIDVVVEGVSLVSNWRSQFREVLGGRTPDKLIEHLRQKNEEMQKES